MELTLLFTQLLLLFAFMVEPFFNKAIFFGIFMTEECKEKINRKLLVLLYFLSLCLILTGGYFALVNNYNFIFHILMLEVFIYFMLFGLFNFIVRKIKYKVCNDIYDKKTNHYYDYRWKLGLFYYDKSNPAFWVQTPNNLGFTVNNANKKSLVFYGILFIIIFPFFFV